MCEIFTITAAVIFTVIRLIMKRNGSGKRAVSFAMMMFWGAALMWAVDGIAGVIRGESFFDISREDTILGLIIVGAGLAAFAVTLIVETLRAKKSTV